MTNLDMDSTMLDSTTLRILIQEWPERIHATIMSTARAVREHLGQGTDGPVRAPSEQGGGDDDSEDDSDDDSGGDEGRGEGHEQRRGQDSTGSERSDGGDGGEPSRRDKRDEQPDAAREGGDGMDGVGDEGSGSRDGGGGGGNTENVRSDGDEDGPAADPPPGARFILAVTDSLVRSVVSVSISTLGARSNRIGCASPSRHSESIATSARCSRSRW